MGRGVGNDAPAGSWDGSLDDLLEGLLEGSREV